MNTNSYLRIENGYDISKITGVIPQNIGEGFQFDLSDKTYTFCFNARAIPASICNQPEV